MKVGILGTGVVGETIGSKLIECGYEVKMGSRTSNNEKGLAWVTKQRNNASSGSFSEAAIFGEIIFNCTKGEHSLAALELAGKEELKGKILIDVSNPLDFSKGMPPTLSIVNSDSLGETIQRTFPEAKVIKALNTLAAPLMVNPKSLSGGDHNLFICGNDKEAKEKLSKILQQFGWLPENILDLGDITMARGTEQMLPVWIRLYGLLGTVNFNFKIIK